MDSTRIAVKELADFSSFCEMNNPPTNWESAMSALAQGAVDYCDIQELLGTCATLADKVRDPNGATDITPSWGYITAFYWTTYFSEGEAVFFSEEAEDLIRMGRVADMAAGATT
jgi:hypothetical protein